MKTVLNILFICLAAQLTAQKNDGFYQTKANETYTKSFQSSKVVPNSTTAKEAIKESILFTDEEDLTLLSSIDSPYGKHYTFIQTYKGYEVHLAHIKVNTDLKGNITSSYSSKKSIDFFNEPKINSSTLDQKTAEFTENLLSQKLVWFEVNNQFDLMMNFTFVDAYGNHLEQIFDHSNTLIEEINLLNHYNDIDTTAKALVFSPNPLTSAGTIYGGKYVDNNDATSSELDAERDTVDIKVSYLNGMFVLENEYLKLVENSQPNIPPVESATPTFFYDRSEPGFENVNVVYHITQLQDYIRSIGFMNIVDYQIHIDCHGFNGADNSAFSYGTNPHSLVFGQGGVDDAEDADVIIHEYTHAIMQSTSPNTNFGTQRNAMDEAFGDYMAVSYSNTYSPHHSDYVFKWDGHNEYWNGRLAVSNKMYPNDLTFNLYADAPMWSSALTRIERNLGREVTMTLALEASYNFTSNMTMGQAAQLYLTTDSLINTGANYATICWVFKDKGMVNSCTVPRPVNLVGVNDLNDHSGISITNTEQFAKGNENILIKCNGTFAVAIYDLSGKLIFEKTNVKQELEITPQQVNSQAVIIQVKHGNKTKNLKVISFQ